MFPSVIGPAGSRFTDGASGFLPGVLLEGLPMRTNTGRNGMFLHATGYGRRGRIFFRTASWRGPPALTCRRVRQ
jgi:hypothetical protein